MVYLNKKEKDAAIKELSKSNNKEIKNIIKKLKSPEKRLIYGIFLVFLVAQTAWIQNFWPFGYLTTGVITLIIYFVGWEFILSFFINKITAKAAFFKIIFLAGSMALILLSSKWYPVI